MDAGASALQQTITLKQAKKLVQCMAHEQSFLLLSPPGVGKSEMVYQAAAESGLPCRSLLGTQIAPEDVSGVPQIIGERSVFCPPRLLLPEIAQTFCLFLDELPACAPDVQKAFYSLLLERRLGEHALPPGHLGGRRRQPPARPRAGAGDEFGAGQPRHHPQSAGRCRRMAGLGAARSGIRADIRSYISFMPDALMREVPQEPQPFSTPRAWALLSQALDMAEQSGILNRETRRALAFGRLSSEDAAVFCALAEEAVGTMAAVESYIERPDLLPKGETARWFILNSHPAECRGRSARRGEAARGRALPAQPADRKPADVADRSGRAMGRARRRQGDARGVAHGHEAMTAAVATSDRNADRATLRRIENGLRMVTVPLPHLAGLAAAVRVNLDWRVPTMGIFASGRHGRQSRLHRAAEGQRTGLCAGT